MTMKELNDYSKLKAKLNRNLETLESLKTNLGAQVLTGMPHSSGISDKTGDTAVEIVEMQEFVDRLQKEIVEKEREIERFISTIEDSQVSLIIRLHYLRGMTWRETAQIIDGGNTKYGVIMRVRRYVEKSC